jgi:hypothetical protein
MSTEKLDFSRELCLIAGFRGEAFHSVQASMLLIGLRGLDFSAADIPRELTGGDKHVSGLATKGLLKMGLIEKVGYIPSPNKDAKGRPVLCLRIPADKVSTARTWLSRHGYQDSLPATQTEMVLAS